MNICIRASNSTHQSEWDIDHRDWLSQLYGTLSTSFPSSFVSNDRMISGWQNPSSSVISKGRMIKWDYQSHASSLSSKVVRYPNDLRMTKYPRSVVVLGCTNGWGGRRQDDSGMARTNTEWLYWLEWTMNDIQTQSAPSLNVTLDLLRRRSHGFIVIIWSRSTVVLTILFPRTTLEWHLISFHYHCVHTFIGPFQHAPD